MKTKNRKIGKCQKENEQCEARERGDNRTTGVNYAHSGHTQSAPAGKRIVPHCSHIRATWHSLAWQGVEAGQHELLICITSSKENLFPCFGQSKIMQMMRAKYQRNFLTLDSFPCFCFLERGNLTSPCYIAHFWIWG